MIKQIITIIAVIIAVCMPVNADKPELFKPRYAKLILSKDKSKILTIALDTTSKENMDHKVLYISKKLDGSFDNIKKISGNVNYEHHIFNNVEFSPVKLPPLYDKNAERETKIIVSHWKNQRKIFNKKNRKLAARGSNVISYDRTPQGEFYITVHYEIRQKNSRFDYNLQRCIRFSDSLESAPLIDFTQKPKLVIESINSRRSKNKKGILVYLDYAGTRSISSDVNRYIDNNAEWEKAKSNPEIEIAVKKHDGTQIDCFVKKLNTLGYRDFDKLSDRQKKRAETALFLLRLPDKGGLISAELDGGPIFGILKASKEIGL